MNVATVTDYNGALAIISHATGKAGRPHVMEPPSAGSQDFLVPVRSRSTLLKKKRKFDIKVIIILVILIILLTIAIIVVSVYYALSKRTKPICESYECIRSAANLATSMDPSANPCEDFYQFTCGRWPEEHPRPDTRSSYDWFLDRQDRVTRHLREFLKRNNSKDDPHAVRQTREMYTACMDTDRMNELQYEPIFKFLEAVGLPRIPHFFNASVTKENFRFDWLKTIAKVKRLLGKDILIGFAIFPDPANRTINRLVLGTPSSRNPFPSLNTQEIDERLIKIVMGDVTTRHKKVDGDDDDDDDDDDAAESVSVLAFKLYTRTVLKYILTSTNKTDKIADFDAKLTNAIITYLNITKILYQLSHDTNNSLAEGDDAYDLTVDAIQNFTDQFVLQNNLTVEPIWRPYLLELFKGRNITLDFNATDTIIVDADELQYMGLIAAFTSKVSHLELELYIWWAAIENMVIHTTSEIRDLRQRLYQSLTAIEGRKVRSLHCTNAVNTLMGMAASYAIADKTFLTTTKPKVQRMFNDIRNAFRSMVRSIDWMDKATKAATLEKCDKMESLIGFPEWLFDEQKLEDYYEGIEINETTHLANMISILRVTFEGELDSLRTKNDVSWATDPTDVNAFHVFQMNAITIPLAILQYPFYNLGLEALNYGAIGAILGHELTHGFDDTGRQFDKFGNIRPWWSNKTVDEYVNRTECFIEQYEGFYVPEVDDHIDGQITLGENIADNGGLAETLHAYKLYQKRNGVEQLLPGFEKYTHMQLLLIAFGNLWCESITPESLKWTLKDSHCPGRIRLHGVMANTPEFAEAFKCRKGSTMNPKRKRCRLW